MICHMKGCFKARKCLANWVPLQMKDKPTNSRINIKQSQTSISPKRILENQETHRTCIPCTLSMIQKLNPENPTGSSRIKWTTTQTLKTEVGQGAALLISVEVFSSETTNNAGIFPKLHQIRARVVGFLCGKVTSSQDIFSVKTLYKYE